MDPARTTDSPRLVAFGPGRVNLLGEHTDYNDGLALPFAIGAGVRVSARPGPEAGICSARADDLGESDSFPLAGPQRRSGWRAFVRGTVAELTAAGVPLSAASLSISGDVPRGRGLSSSAALEVALCLALAALASASLPEPFALAEICSRVENNWVGVRSGLLDQIASICGRADEALVVDFAARTTTPVPLALGDYSLVCVDSGQARRLGTSGYNRRIEECREACALLGLSSLREADLDGARSLPAPLDRRVRHVVSENDRVRAAVAVLGDGDREGLAELLNRSHASLRDDYEVSTPQVDRTVAALRDHGAIGARILGGGFGGSILALLAPGVPVPEGGVRLEAADGARLLEPTEPTERG